MIDLQTEKLIPLADVPKLKLIPRRRRGGGRLDISTVYRWAQRGLRGIRLETIQVGGQRCTSVESLGRFFTALSCAPTRSPESPSTPQRETQIALAEAELAAAGI